MVTKMITDLGKNDWAFPGYSSVHLVWFCPDSRYFDRTNGEIDWTDQKLYPMRKVYFAKSDTLKLDVHSYAIIL